MHGDGEDGEGRGRVRMVSRGKGRDVYGGGEDGEGERKGEDGD